MLQEQITWCAMNAKINIACSFSVFRSYLLILVVAVMLSWAVWMAMYFPAIWPSCWHPISWAAALCMMKVLVLIELHITHVRKGWLEFEIGKTGQSFESCWLRPPHLMLFTYRIIYNNFLFITVQRQFSISVHCCSLKVTVTVCWRGSQLVPNICVITFWYSNCISSTRYLNSKLLMCIMHASAGRNLFDII